MPTTAALGSCRVCTGAFALAAAGLLDDRRATTHWMYAERLARRYPRIRLDPDVLYLSDGRVFTSAGTAAGIDLCLHLVALDHGVEVAATVARRLVMPLYRLGWPGAVRRQPDRSGCRRAGRAAGRGAAPTSTPASRWTTWFGERW